MKSNGLLKWLMIPVALLLIFGGIRLFSGSTHRTQTASNNPPSTAGQLTREEMKSLGVAGDTPQDTVATLVGEVKQLRAEVHSTVDENKRQVAENERLRARESTVDQRVHETLTTEENRWRNSHDQSTREQQQTQGLLQDLQRRLDAVSTKTGQADVPVGLGLDESDPQSVDSNRTRWIEPQDSRSTQDKSATPKSPSTGAVFQFLPEPNDARTDKMTGAHEGSTEPNEGAQHVDGQRSRGAPPLRTAYTVPADSTLMGSIAMTALIGRVPVDGTVNDPYPFKVIFGRDNLTANGIELPDIAGAVASGTASGDWTLSCVRGRIRSVTFVFRDGTIRTVGGSTSHLTESSSTQGGLGWISDPFGIPCVSGERRSNAQQYLTSQMLITAAGAGAASLIPSQSGSFSFVGGSNGSALGTVGITGNEAMGRILASGVQDMSQWVNKLYGQAFAAVYVRPGADVAVHIEQPLELDYDPQGRRVRQETGDVHASELD